MKPVKLIAVIFFLFFSINAHSQGILGKIKSKVQQKVDNKEDNAIDKSIDQADPTNKGKSTNNTTTNSNNTNETTTTTINTEPVNIKTYQNYDFVPGDSIVFYDDFTEDQDGEFPSHWNLEAGQGVVNKIGNDPGFFLTEGNYVRVNPLMKTESYLSNTFTVEFDYYAKSGSYAVICFLKSKDADGNDRTSDVNFENSGGVSTGYFPKDFNASYPGKDEGKKFEDNWHHAALIMKNNQMKCYVDQYRVLVMPNVGIKPTSIEFGGIGSQENPLIFKNVRVANGGNMNMIGQKFTASKIVTHGITFDVDQSTIKPESMGTLNMIVGVLKANPDIKFEIDGHTDNTGTPAHNATLSQQRADAVKAQLISMGIDASRLTTKGFGDTKPIDTNDTASGRAENRRVEFVKK